ncbi:MAG: hypothetical protein J5892_03965 [Bacilli bacterium]|nr:hypothetical protein [Bacilli bacterium]
MSKRGILFLIGIGIVILGLSGLLVYRLFFYQTFFKTKKEVKMVDKIKDYNYVLEDRDSKLYKTNFKELKNVLSKSDIDYEAYATLLTKLYIIDFYTLDNKISKYDVGGLDFIKESDQTNYKSMAMNTYYKNVKDNSNNKRSQKLPIVNNVKVINIEDTIYNKKDEGYLIDVFWEYDKTYNAANHANVTLVKEDNKLYLVKIETIKEDTE